MDLADEIGLGEVPDLGRIAELEAVGEQHRAHRAVGDDRAGSTRRVRASAHSRRRRRHATARRCPGRRPDRTVQAPLSGSGGLVSVSTWRPLVRAGSTECNATFQGGAVTARSVDSGQDVGMVPGRRRRSILHLVVVLGLAVSWAAGSTPRPATGAESSLPAWTGGVNLYRDGSFTTQKSWLWCTAAGVQIVRNIVDRRADHSTSGQRRYFAWMRERNRYDLPLSAGVDPAGWAAGLRHFVDDRYRLVSSRTFAVGPAVCGHPSAADQPARRADGLARQPRLDPDRVPGDGRSGHDDVVHGDQRPRDRSPLRAPEQERLRHGPEHEADDRAAPALLTPWKYAPRSMVWDGRYVSIQPIPTTDPAPVARPAPTAGALGSSVIDATRALGSSAGAVPSHENETVVVASPAADLRSPSPAAVSRASVSERSPTYSLPVIVGSVVAVLLVLGVGG